MRCLMCGKEMVLIRAIEDTAMGVPGYERQSWQCSTCLEVEYRFVFTREKTVPDEVSVQPTHPEQHEADLPTSTQERGAAPSNSEQGSMQTLHSPLAPDHLPAQLTHAEATEADIAMSTQTAFEKRSDSIQSGPSPAAVDPQTDITRQEPHFHVSTWTRAVAKLRRWQKPKG
jgi:hypothetical protein